MAGAAVRLSSRLSLGLVWWALAVGAVWSCGWPARIGRLRHLIWTAITTTLLTNCSGRATWPPRWLFERRDVPARHRQALVEVRQNLRRCLANSVDSLIDYGACDRSKLPISTSRAEGCVGEIANARMAKKRRMRWSPHGGHRVATVRAAVLDESGYLKMLAVGRSRYSCNRGP
jgi:hypothetical protein